MPVGVEIHGLKASCRNSRVISYRSDGFIAKQCDDNFRAFAGALVISNSPFICSTLPHSGETQTVMSIFEVESGAIITQLQPNSADVAA